PTLPPPPQVPNPLISLPYTLINAKNQRSGDLPSEVRVLKDYLETDSFGDPLGIDEGAGMAELVHDMAPGAAISFHTAFVSETDFAEAIHRLRADGCDVICDDIIYFAEPAYQDGPVAQAATASVNAGVPYYSSIGNGYNQGFKMPFRDVNPAVD